jgi:hypothetical protein
MEYYHVKFGQGTLDDTVIFVDKVIEAEHLHRAVEIVCGDWKWELVVCPGVNKTVYIFSDTNDNRAEAQEVYSCQSISAAQLCS